MTIDFKGFLKQQEIYLHFYSAIESALHFISASLACAGWVDTKA